MNEFLTWQDGQLDDFTLKLEFKLTGSDEAKANSGVQIRSRVKPDGHVFGYQADLDLAGQWVGACTTNLAGRCWPSAGSRGDRSTDGKITTKDVADSAELLKAVKKGDWNEYEITAQGSKITLTINGKKTVEIDDQQKAERELSGLLALQLHSGPPKRVEFKNIRLKRHKFADGRKKVVFVAGRPSHGRASTSTTPAACCWPRSSKKRRAEDCRSRRPSTRTAGRRIRRPSTTPTASSCTATAAADTSSTSISTRSTSWSKKGVGIVCIHYGVEVPKGPSGEKFLDWIGGYFEPNWSVNPHWTAKFDEVSRPSDHAAA